MKKSKKNNSVYKDTREHLRNGNVKEIHLIERHDLDSRVDAGDAELIAGILQKLVEDL